MLGTLLAAGLAGVACGEGHREHSVEGPFAWGGTPNVRLFGHIYLAGQPDAAGLAAAREAGVTTVINLRAPSEQGWDEAAAAEAEGLTYYNVPVPVGEPFSRDAMERIEALVKQHHDETILVHCASANRAAGWLAIHVAERHGKDTEAALAVGRRMGITKEAIAQRVRDYLAR